MLVLKKIKAAFTLNANECRVAGCVSDTMPQVDSMQGSRLPLLHSLPNLNIFQFCDDILTPPIGEQEDYLCIYELREISQWLNLPVC